MYYIVTIITYKYIKNLDITLNWNELSKCQYKEALKSLLENLNPNRTENFIYLENVLQFASNYIEISRGIMMHCRHVWCPAHSVFECWE